MSKENVGTEVADERTVSAVRTAIEVGIRLGTIALLALACVIIIAPFLGLVVWGLIVAIAADGPFDKVCGWLKGRRKLAAVLAVTVALLALLVPAIWLSETLVSGARDLAAQLEEGSLQVPPPSPGVADWPIVGPRLHSAWTLASENLSEALAHLQPQLQSASKWALRAAGSAGAGILQLLASVVIAGVLLVKSESWRVGMERFAIRMSGRERGAELAALSRATVRSVVQGILGVAIVQALLAGAGLAVAGIPAAGLWALLVLVAAVVQLPTFLVLLPPVLYAFSTIGGVPAILLAVWCLAVGFLDNILKPLLFGRGVDTPSLILFMGALGGMLAMGIVGLFLGAVVLAVGYTLFRSWLDASSERGLPPDAANG